MNKTVALMLLAAAAPLFAQDEERSILLPETRVVASDVQPFNPGRGLMESPAEVPLTLSLVTPENAQTLKDVLRWTPGVSTHTGNGVHDFFTLRGFDSLTAVNVAIDGVVEPETSFYHMQSIDQVQVAKGPLSTFFGRDSLAGNINLIRKRPVEGSFTRLGLEAGSFDTFAGDLDGNLDASGTRVNARFEQSHGFRRGMDSEVLGLHLAQSLDTWLKSDRLSSTFLVDYSRSEQTPDAGVPTLGSMLAPGIGRRRSFQDPQDFSDQNIVRLAFDTDYELNDAWQLQNKLYYTDFDWESSGVILAGFAKFGAGLEEAPSSLARIRPVLDDKQRILGDHLALRGDFDRHAVLVGAEVRQLSDEFDLSLDSAADVDVRSGTRSPSILPPVPANAGDATLGEYSLYVIDEIKLGDSTKLLGGLRGQIFDFEDDALGTSRDDELVSGSVGLLREVSDGAAVYINAGTAYAAPSTQVQGERGKPEESASVEGGVRFESADERVSGNAAVFHVDRDNIAIPNSTGATTASGGQESTGVELDVRTKVNERFAVLANYTWLDSELTKFTEFDARGLMDRGGNTAPFAPEHAVSLRGKLGLTAELALDAGVLWQDSQFIAPDNGYEIDDQTYVEAGVQWERRNWLARVGVRNLLDEDLFGRGSAGASSVRPEDGFGVFGRLERRF